MSVALVRKSLQIVDPSFDTGHKTNRKKKGQEVFDFLPENYRYISQKPRKGGKVGKLNVLPAKRKETVNEARKKFKTKQQVLEENLKKLNLIKEASRVDLDKDTINQIIERAVTKRPIKKGRKQKKNKKTAFTEEDFKKFEEEYFDE